LSGSILAVTPYVPGARAEGFFFIERPKLGLSTSYEFEEEKRTLPETETKTISHDMIEKATIDTKGWLYHENLMEYRFSFQPEWRQEKFEYPDTQSDESPTNRRNSYILGYDTGAKLLKKKALSLDVFANRKTRQLDLSYIEDTDIESKTWGTRLNFTNSVLPASVGFTRRQASQTGFYNSDEDRDEVQVKVRHNIRKSVTELYILSDDTRRTTRTDTNFSNIESNTTNTELTNTFFFTGDEHLRLDSLLYLIQAEYDDVDIDTRLLSENFFWTHNKHLLTQYAFNYNRREVDDVDTEEKAFNAMLTHRLGETLTTNAGAGAAFSDFAEGSEDRYRGDLGFIYRHPIAWGSVELGAACDYAMTNRNGTGNIIPTDERHILRIGEEAVLKNETVVIESIVVTDTTGAIVYTKNIDYLVSEIGTEVRIRRSLLGAIADGQEVIVRYSYKIEAGYDDARFGQDYRIDVALWSFMYLNYTHRRLDQSIRDGEPPPNRADDTYNRARIRFDTGWWETRFEYEKQDRKSGSSTETKSISQLINLRTFRSLSVNFSAHYGRREYTDTHDKETFYTVGSEVSWTPEWWCTFTLVGLRNKISGDLQDMIYSEIAPKILLRYGVWTASVISRLRTWTPR